jgi:hypothetical protein
VQNSYKVEGPACETRIVQGLLKENATAAPWISDPTTADACVRGGPRRAPGAPVHSGPHRRGIPLFDWRRRSAIQRPRTRASGSGGGVRRRAAARDGG